MRILSIHSKYRSGGAEIVGNWPPAWVAYLSGHLRKVGFDDIQLIDAMTDEFSGEALRVQGKERAAERAQSFKMPTRADVKACGGGSEQMEDV